MQIESLKPRIPRIIHQIYFSQGRPLREALAKNIEAIKVMNPAWEHRLYDDQSTHDFITQQYGTDVLQLFQKINPKYGAARADLFRYLVMYKCGGVYLDIKSTTINPLDETIRPDDEFLLSLWRNGPGEPFAGFGVQKEFGPDHKRELQQWHIIASPGHLFLKAVIERVLRNIETYRPWVHGVGNKGVCRVTGPIAYTLAIEPLVGSFPCRKVSDETALSLQYSIYDGLDAHLGLFGAYYGFLSDPIITMSGWRLAPSTIYCSGRKSLIYGRALYRRMGGVERFSTT